MWLFRRRKHLVDQSDQNIIRDEDISKRFSDEQERKFRATIVRYHDEDTARIIMEARQQAYDDINAGRVKPL